MDASSPSPAAEGQLVDGKLQLVDQVPVQFRGRTLTVTGIVYAHLSGSQNLSACELTIRFGQRVETFRLERMGPPTFQTHSGLELALEGVDPYHQPSRAWLLIK